MAVNIKENVFREYDIRGVFGEDLSFEFAELLAKAFVRFVKEKSGKQNVTVSVGRDIRLSSPELRNAVVKGLTASGADTIDLGECPTPLQYFSMFNESNGVLPDGGIMITGSHNPSEYNGFKISLGKNTLHGEDIQELKKLMKTVQQEDLLNIATGQSHCGTSGKLKFFNVKKAYLEWVTNDIKLNVDKPIKVVIDSGNATGGLVAPELLKSLGCEVVELYCDIDGTFPNHHPDPTVPENLKDLIEKVKETKADLGIGYDGDSDRIGAVDENGSIIYGDQLMIIYSHDILESQPGSTIVGDVKCSNVMYDEINSSGGKAVMWKTGHSLIKSKMKELGASLAGEMSGHIFFADRFFGFDDAIYSSCRLIEILAKKRSTDPLFTTSMLLKDIKSTVSTPEIRIDCPDDEKFAVIDKLKEKLSKVTEGPGGLKVKEVIDIDGIRIEFEGGWALGRTSNTQPVMVFRFEAETKDTLLSLKDFVFSMVKEIKPDINLGDS